MAYSGVSEFMVDSPPTDGCFNGETSNEPISPSRIHQLLSCVAAVL